MSVDLWLSIGKFIRFEAWRVAKWAKLYVQFSSIRSFEVSIFSVRFSWKIALIVRSYSIQYSLRANNVDYLFVKQMKWTQSCCAIIKQNVCFPFNFIEISPIFHRNVYNVYFIQNLQSTCDIETVSRIDNVYIKIQHKIHILFGIGWSLCCVVLFILFCFFVSNCLISSNWCDL